MNISPYKHYFDLLKATQSPFSSVDLENIVAVAERRKRSNLWRWMPISTLGLLLVLFNPSTQLREVQRAGTTPLPAVGVSPPIAKIPEHEQSKLTMWTQRIHRKAQLEANRIENIDSRFSAMKPDTVANPSEIQITLPAVLVPQESISNGRPITLTSIQQTREEGRNTGALIAGLSSGLLNLRNVRLDFSYSVSAKLFVGISGGLFEERFVSPTAGVAFHDTTIEVNGQSYTSKIGTLIPRLQSRESVSMLAGVKYYFLSPIERWNVYTSLFAGLTIGQVAVAAGAGVRYNFINSVWMNSVFELEYIPKFGFASPIGRIGFEWQWE